jgi:serine/threonine protein kinase
VIHVGQTCIRVRIFIECKGCGSDIPSGDREAQSADGSFLCAACRATSEKTTVIVNEHVPAPTLVFADGMPPELPNAPRFPGYRIVSELGRGGMGVVFKAFHEATRQPVAIKTILATRQDSEKILAIFKREIEVQSQLKHPNIVALKALEYADSLLGMVLEFVDGQDLAKFIKSKGGKVALADAAPILKGTLAGLAVSHAAGIVHRDLKPENIFLANDAAGWTPKIADFGLAKSYEQTGRSMLEVAGTPPFWPREHVTDYCALHPMSDVFSIAAVFYLMLTGSHARQGMSEMLKSMAAQRRQPGFGEYSEIILKQPIVPIRQRDATIPQAIADVLDRALREPDSSAEDVKDRHALRETLADLRYPNAGALRDALTGALRRGGL